MGGIFAYIGLLYMSMSYDNYRISSSSSIMHTCIAVVNIIISTVVHV